MSDVSASTPAVQEWASDWADCYDQEISPEQLESFVGKNVKGEGQDSEGPRGFEKFVVGWGRDVLVVILEDGTRESAYRPSLITSEGLQVPIFSGMVLEVVMSDG